MTSAPRPSSRDATCAKVVGGRRRNGQRGRTTYAPAPLPAERAAQSGLSSRGGRRRPRSRPAEERGELQKRRRIRSPVLEGQYGEVIAKARQAINLSELGVEKVRARRAATGALVYEIPGSDGKMKADLFAGRLWEVIGTVEGDKVARPVRMAEIRIHGLDESIKTPEIVAEVARIGGCEASDVRTGLIRFSPKELGTLWVKCPLATADKIAREGKIPAGWLMARVELLKARPL